MPRAVVLLNPRARTGAQTPVGRILRGFRSSGWQVELWASEQPGWTEQAARRAVAEGVEAVFGAGGDGMLADILPAIVGTEVALGVVPLGTGNVWARELGLPLDPERAVRAQLAQVPQRVDVGRANGRPFLVVASAGLDAEIVRVVEEQAKALGQIAYPLAWAALVGTARGVPCRVQFEDEAPIEIDLLAGIATNGRLYGGVVALVPDARVYDGMLDVALFPARGPADAWAHVARVVTGLHLGERTIVIRRARRLHIEHLGSDSLPVETDGDPRGTTPLTIEVLPSSVLALGVPPPY